MANPLPNEFELIAQIKEEKITIDSNILDFLYHYIGDDITGINLLCQYYLMNNEPIPLAYAERILIYTRDIEVIINNITMVSVKDNFPFPQFIDNIPLHPIIRELMTYHFGNDIFIINLIVYDAIDPLKPQFRQIPVENIQKILNRSTSIKLFLEKLRLSVSA